MPDSDSGRFMDNIGRPGMMDCFKISIICFMFVVLGEPDHIFAPYQRLINKLPWYLNKPMGSCFYCLTGEVSLWYYVFKIRIDITFEGILTFLAFISFSIFLTRIYSIVWNYEQ